MATTLPNQQFINKTGVNKPMALINALFFFPTN